MGLMPKEELRVAVLLFAVTAYLFRQSIQKKRDKYEEETVVIPEGSTVASRGILALSPPIPYLSKFFKCLQDPCDPTDNPSGYIALCVAENKLITDLMAERLMQPGTATAAFSSSDVYCYNSFLGLPLAREAVSYFLVRKFLLPDTKVVAPEDAFQLINPQQVAIGSGCAALINYLFYILGEPGDTCLVPAPYYAAFESDMKIIAGCVPFAVQMANPAMGPTPTDLNLAYMEARARGLNVKFLLLTNPNNPLGVIYRSDVITKAIAWARKRGMHTIVDEIYALSTRQKLGHGFESVVKVLNNDLGTDVHFLWALSKDFGASGFRFGVLYSQNDQMLAALSNLSIFSGVSHPIQMVVAELLTDDKFVDQFLDDARTKLNESYHICTAKLEEMVIPFVPAEAGLFIYCDFSLLLPEKSFNGERQFCDLMMEYGRLVLTPGETQCDRTPGMFRICYAWISPEVLEIAMERLSKLVAKVRRLDWADLNETTVKGIL